MVRIESLKSLNLVNVPILQCQVSGPNLLECLF